MVPAFIVSAFYGERAAMRAFALCAVPFMLAGGLLTVLTKPPTGASLRMREGTLVVAAAWFLTSALGAFPYVLSGAMPSFIDAFFESASGFTTTGVTLLDDLHELPRGLLFWRSFSHWLGGMGILVFTISVLPALGIGALPLAKAETPGPTLDKVATRLSDNAKYLYLLYIALSAAAFILLLAGGTAPFDAILHTFGSLGNGGLSNYAGGIAQLGAYAEFIIAFFCILSSVNFIAYNDLLRRRWREFFRASEIRAFFVVIAVCVVLVGATLAVKGVYDSILTCLGHAFIQVSAFITTSGYADADYSTWPTFCRFILFILMFVGGCSSSTAGGLKMIRVLVLFKLIRRNLYKRLHPRAVVTVKLGDRALSEDTASDISAFALLYFIMILAGSAVLSLDGRDMLTTLSTTVSILSNSGIGFGADGFAQSFSFYSAPARLFLSALMIAGRLELFTVILLLSPSFWRPSDR